MTFRPLSVGALLALLSVAPPALVAQDAGHLIQAGDRVLLRVTGETGLSDTFTVTPELTLELPPLGSVPLAGVRRDSIQPHLAEFLGRYLRAPAVRAEVLLRLGILGEVVRPGFYALPAGAALEDLIMIAGGMTRDARFERAKLQRDGRVLLQREKLRGAVAGGETLAALDLRSGDALEIPRRPDQEGKVRIISGLVALPIAIYSLTRLF